MDILTFDRKEALFQIGTFGMENEAKDAICAI